MFDAPAQLPPLPAVPAPAASPRNRTADMLRGLMAVVLSGVVIAVIALLFFRWPVLGKDNIPYDYASHPQRLAAAGEGPRGAIGILIDASVYVVLLAVVVMALRTLRTGKRNWLGAQVILGLLGLAYVVGMVLYIGPMVSACGFSLIVFGALVAWIAADPGEPEETDIDDTDHVPAVETVSVEEPVIEDSMNENDLASASGA